MDQHINLLLQLDEEDLEMRAALACVLVLRIEDARTQKAHHCNESRLGLSMIMSIFKYNLIIMG